MIMDDCPKCGANLETEEICTDLFGDPFNGIVVECDCGAELDLTIRVSVEVIK